jgi:CheY-like chemotaxis protein
VGLAEVRVLVVEDNRSARDGLLALLRSWGCEAQATPGVNEALEALREASQRGKPYDFALIDSDLGGGSGEQLGAAIKGDASLEAATVVMLTTLGKRLDPRHLAGLGIASQITKPVQPARLLDLLVSLRGGERLASRTPEPLPSTAASPTEAGGKCRVLVAEDNETNRIVATKFLEKAGYHAEAVTTGVEALERLAQTRYDLVLMDVQMPEMDGLQATRRIRDPRSPVLDHDIPIIAMTAHTMETERKACYDAGMNAHIAKPIDFRKMQEVIRGTLDNIAPPAPDSRTAVSAPDAGFDREGLLARTGGDGDLVRLIVETFMNDTPRKIEALREAAARLEGENVALHAHTLKGSAANAGATRIEELSAQAESAGREGNIAGVGTLVERIEAAFDSVARAIGGEDLT